MTFTKPRLGDFRRSPAPENLDIEPARLTVQISSYIFGPSTSFLLVISGCAPTIEGLLSTSYKFLINLRRSLEDQRFKVAQENKFVNVLSKANSPETQLGTFVSEKSRREISAET